MSTPENNPIPIVRPFGNSQDPCGFYQLLLAHVTWLAVHNFSKTTVEKRALYVKAFAMWCIDCDLTSPHVITKPILEAFQRHTSLADCEFRRCMSSDVATSAARIQLAYRSFGREPSGSLSWGYANCR